MAYTKVVNAIKGTYKPQEEQSCKGVWGAASSQFKLADSTGD